MKVAVGVSKNVRQDSANGIRALTWLGSRKELHAVKPTMLWRNERVSNIHDFPHPGLRQRNLLAKHQADIGKEISLR